MIFNRPEFWIGFLLAALINLTIKVKAAVAALRAQRKAGDNAPPKEATHD